LDEFARLFRSTSCKQVNTLGDRLASLKASLLSGYLPRLGQEKAIDTGFQGWICKGTYSPVYSDISLGIHLQQVSASDFVPYVNRDFERFSLASRESFFVSLVDRQASSLSGWPLLKLYYSSFFAAHAIMRSRGVGVVNLNKSVTDHLNAVLCAYHSSSLNVSPGQFVYKVIQDSHTSSGEISISLSPAVRGSGVHDSFWVEFCDFLVKEASKAVEIAVPFASDFVAGVSELSDAIKGGGSHGAAWISGVRNEINYQHRHNTWFPLERKNNPLDALLGATYHESSTIRLDLSKTKNVIQSFVNVTKYLACLNIELSDFVAARSTKNGAFGQKWRRLEVICNSYHV
jgi:hypothetical protein